VSIYLGQHLRLSQKQAAIKILYAPHLSQEEVEAFRREADTIAALSHPHIVTIHDFDVEQGMPFLVMDYYPDGTLRQRHSKGIPLAVPIVVSYVQQVAQALQYAHDHRVIHRDVKSANMLISKRGEVVLSDFGVAAVAQGTKSIPTQPLAGTAPYIAPEQIEERPRRESDQYALAIVVYEWLTGLLPFTATASEIMIKHLSADPPLHCHQIPNMRPAIEQAIRKALAAMRISCAISAKPTSRLRHWVSAKCLRGRI
jgi:serine/threonine protein kinase